MVTLLLGLVQNTETEQEQQQEKGVIKQNENKRRKDQGVWFVTCRSDRRGTGRSPRNSRRRTRIGRVRR
jgi:hypothetical protein